MGPFGLEPKPDGLKGRCAADYTTSPVCDLGFEPRLNRF